MRIGILLDPYGEGSPGGLGRFVYAFTKALIEGSPTDTFTVYTKEDTKPTFSGGNWTGRVLHVRRLWLTGGRAIDVDLDCHIFFTPIIPLFFRPKRTIVFALDFSYLELPKRSIRQSVLAFVLKKLHGRSFARATHIVAITQATKDALMKYFGIAPEKVTVIHLGYVVSDVKPESILVPEKYFMFAGVLKERKNVLGIVRAFAQISGKYPDYQLLIAGKKRGEYYESLKRLVEEKELTSRVEFLGYISDAELACVYQHTRAFVFPSFVEGFGMPVLEAMHAGVPVITSNRGALAEVAGNAALLVNPDDNEDIARAMSSLIDDDNLRAELVEKGKKRAQLFTWEKASRELATMIHGFGNPS